MYIFLGLMLACSAILGRTPEESPALTTKRWAYDPYSPNGYRIIGNNAGQFARSSVVGQALGNLTVQSPQRRVRKRPPPLIFSNDKEWKDIIEAVEGPHTDLLNLMTRVLREDVKIAVPARDIGILVKISERVLTAAGREQPDQDLSYRTYEDLIRFLFFSMSLVGADIGAVKRLQLNCVKSYLGLGNLMGIKARDARSVRERNKNNQSAFAYFQLGFDRAIEFGFFKDAGTCFLCMSKLSHYLGEQYSIYMDECSSKLTVDFFLGNLGSFEQHIRPKDRNTIAGLFSKTPPQLRVL